MTDQPLINGLHHITAMTANAQSNYDFYSKTLGLRLVKRTVNFDAPDVYHFYYADAAGTPGSVMTFFPFSGMPEGAPGVGQATITQYKVPVGALDFWERRLSDAGAKLLARETVFAEERLIARDDQGLLFALVETADAADRTEALWTTAEISAEVAIRGFHGVTLALKEAGRTAAILTQIFDYRHTGEEQATGGEVLRFTATGPEARLGRHVDIHVTPAAPDARDGAGTVHHIAFSVSDRAAQDAIRARVAAAGHHVTPVIDRDYFNAIYFRTPGGVLFEVATDEPGFDRDEPAETMGAALKLPSRYETARGEIEQRLPAVAF